MTRQRDELGSTLSYPLCDGGATDSCDRSIDDTREFIHDNHFERFRESAGNGATKLFAVRQNMKGLQPTGWAAKSDARKKSSDFLDRKGWIKPIKDGLIRWPIESTDNVCSEKRMSNRRFAASARSDDKTDVPSTFLDRQ